MTDINNTLRHGEMMYALGHGFGASDARSAMMNALFTAQYRTLTEDEISAVIGTVDAIIKKSMDEHSALFHQRADALS
jgi:hypothetical protein